MAYATLTDVEAFNSARALTATSQPNIAQVERFLDLTAAEIDAVLIEKGYELPIATTATGALLLLAGINAKGAWALTERSAASSPHLKEAQEAWKSAMQMLSNASQVMEAAKTSSRAGPRGPGQTTPPAYPLSQRNAYDPTEIGEENPENNPLLPLISREQRF